MTTAAGASAQEAANDFERLVHDSLALRKVIDANSSAFNSTYIDGYEQYLKSLERFGKSLTPQFSLISAPLYPFKLISSTIWLRWYSTDNFNAIHKYRSIFVDYWKKAQEKLGQAPTPNAPEPPKAQQKPLTDDLMGMAKVAGIAAIALAGIYVWRSSGK